MREGNKWQKEKERAMGRIVISIRKKLINNDERIRSVEDRMEGRVNRKRVKWRIV